MSYILDALKKSEQARGSRKTRRMFEEFPELPPPHFRTSRSPRRWLYLVAFILLLNLCLFVFLAAPWRSSAPPPLAKTSRTTASKPPAQISRTTSPKPTEQISPNTSPNPTEHPPLTTSPKPKASGISAGGPPAATVTPSPPTARASKHSPLSAARKRKSPGLDLASPTAAAHRTATTSHRTAAAPSPPITRASKHSSLSAARKRKSPGLGLASPTAAARRRTALEIKTSALKALLEKQAERSEKARGQSFSDVRNFATPNSANEPQVQRFDRLPSQIRDALPNMSVSMLDYSKRPADSFIIINGTKRRAGDEIYPGLKLERITPDGAIFAYRGQRFYMNVLGY